MKPAGCGALATAFRLPDTPLKGTPTLGDASPRHGAARGPACSSMHTHMRCTLAERARTQMLHSRRKVTCRARPGLPPPPPTDPPPSPDPHPPTNAHHYTPCLPAGSPRRRGRTTPVWCTPPPPSPAQPCLQEAPDVVVRPLQYGVDPHEGRPARRAGAEGLLLRRIRVAPARQRLFDNNPRLKPE